MKTVGWLDWIYRKGPMNQIHKNRIQVSIKHQLKLRESTSLGRYWETYPAEDTALFRVSS